MATKKRAPSISRAKAGAAAAVSPPPKKARTERARPPVSGRDAGATRDRILAAGEAEFAAHGLRGARVQEIVARAGVNERMLYHHFGDKDGLYQAILERFLTGVAAAVEKALEASGPDPQERLRDMLRRYFGGMATHPNIVRLFLHEALAGWPSQHKLAELRKAIDKRLYPLVTAFFAEAQRSGVFREGLDPRVAALVAGGACLMIPLAMPRVQQIFASDFSDPAELRAVQDAMIDTLLQGILARRKPSR